MLLFKNTNLFTVRYVFVIEYVTRTIILFKIKIIDCQSSFWQKFELKLLNFVAEISIIMKNTLLTIKLSNVFSCKVSSLKINGLINYVVKCIMTIDCYSVLTSYLRKCIK